MRHLIFFLLFLSSVALGQYTPLTVDVDNWPATNACTESGVWSVGVNNFPASQAVTGSFYQATQPVSIASMPSTPVTGTFYQATQPVSIASMPSTPVTGTFWQATQPVSIATAPALVASSAVIGHVIVDTAPTTAVTGTFYQATQPVSETNLDLAQGSTTSGEAGPLVQGAVTSASPSYTTAKTNPLSMDTSGNLRVSLGGTAANTNKLLVTADAVTFASPQHVIVDTAPSTAVTGTFWQATQPVSGTVTANAGSGTMAVSLASAPTTAVTQAASSISGSNPCSNPTATIVGINGATSGTAKVQLIALSGSTKIYICSMNITGVSGTTPTFSLVYGTGTACATGTTTIVGAWTTAANTIYNFVGPTVAVTTAGQALCYLDTGTTPIQNYNITYVQQ